MHAGKQNRAMPDDLAHGMARGGIDLSVLSVLNIILSTPAGKTRASSAAAGCAIQMSATQPFTEALVDAAVIVPKRNFLEQ